jgi:hypothetical protein
MTDPHQAGAFGNLSRMDKFETCKSCGRIREYPYCLDEFHKTSSSKDVLDAVRETRRQQQRFATE